nr:PREDICTED: uncharacterized protein LOC103314393 isoform X2 [Tribolium castaneum]|eukprot:XP_015838625.1 PREDICTED: uncharacterized protein LOC103314393 isoform X2 [Tribolium castaneum]
MYVIVIDYFILFWKSFTWFKFSLLVICFCTQFFTFTISDLYLLCYVETVTILTTLHLKEFQRSLKSRELANSFPYQVLISIICKQVTTNVLNLLSDPDVINYYILRSCAPDSSKFNDFNRVKIMQNTKTPSIQLIQTQRLEGGNPKLEYEKVTNFTRTRRKHRRFTESSLATPSLADILDKILLEDDEPQDRMSSILETCAKAVMRVIDKITIALSENCPEDETFDGSKRWWFKQEKAKNSDFYERMTKFLEKKNFSYETGDFFEYLQQNDKHLRFDDEFGDFAITKILFEIFCELLVDDKETSLTKEPVIQSILLLFGNCIEKNVVTQANYYLRYCCANAKIPSEGKIETLSMELEEFVSVVLTGIPDSVKSLVGENTLKGAISLFVSSLQIQEINQDIILQIFEICCFKLIEAVIS